MKCGEVLYRFSGTASYQSKLPLAGIRAASPNSMAHWDFLLRWPPLVLASQNFPAAFAIFGHAGTPCPDAGDLQQDSSRQQCQENSYTTPHHITRVISGANEKSKTNSPEDDHDIQTGLPPPRWQGLRQ